MCVFLEWYSRSKSLDVSKTHLVSSRVHIKFDIYLHFSQMNNAENRNELKQNLTWMSFYCFSNSSLLKIAVTMALEINQKSVCVCVAAWWTYHWTSQDNIIYTAIECSVDSILMGRLGGKRLCFAWVKVRHTHFSSVFLCVRVWMMKL